MNEFIWFGLTIWLLIKRVMQFQGYNSLSKIRLSKGYKHPAGIGTAPRRVRAPGVRATRSRFESAKKGNS